MVDYVSVDTPDGRAGFLRGALSRVAVLSAGVIEVTVGDEKIRFACSDGIFCITRDGMTVVTSDCRDSADEDFDLGGAGLSGRQYRYAKARVAASLIKMKSKNIPEDTF